MAVTEIWLVRHGESLANVAAERAERAGADVIEVEYRDADVPLSPLGEQQSRALGRELADRGVDDVSAALWVSPYLRAQQTIGIALAAGGVTEPTKRVDERLRDRELGVLDLLTLTGVRNRHPDEERRRQWLGKYYHRPAGGESWVDVMARLRSLLVDVDRLDGADRLVLAAHDAVVMLMVAVCLDLDEPALMDFAGDHTVANASLTRLRRDGVGQPWTLEEFSAVEHLDETEVTEHSGRKDDVRVR
ncbi:MULTISPECIES: histidine phosphatase family protein [unclassified Curtobacterium]|uniref:histidine phosphatase family protein n=1 Tax=unclassified Curtobacterium TaxID=257496 RepID=UPI0008DCE62F|nr:MULTISPECIES: histidine phosphatase family protein [unclassified Curtobacterium]OIH98065.1 phosphoglycerate mutase [Curtobacterium sp. MCBA15_003]OII11204.1 phosphoglycerate mutase [Curtobacterium sp. MCBA15_009]OII32814.1 phosphoglycerate mutase [Curtobacterium sp. MMLR14_006]